MSGKGDKPRPLSITKEEFVNRWDEIFKKKLIDIKPSLIVINKKLVKS